MYHSTFIILINLKKEKFYNILWICLCLTIMLYCQVSVMPKVISLYLKKIIYWIILHWCCTFQTHCENPQLASGSWLQRHWPAVCGLVWARRGRLSCDLELDLAGPQPWSAVAVATLVSVDTSVVELNSACCWPSLHINQS